MAFFHHDFILTSLPSGPDYLLNMLGGGGQTALETLDDEDLSERVIEAAAGVTVQNRNTRALADFDPMPQGAELFECFVQGSILSIVRHAERFAGMSHPWGEEHRTDDPEFMILVKRFLVSLNMVTCSIGDEPFTRYQNADQTRLVALVAILADRVSITWKELAHIVWALNPFAATTGDLMLGDWSEIPAAWQEAINALRTCDEFLDVCTYDLQGLSDRPVGEPDFDTVLDGLLDCWYHPVTSVEDYCVPDVFYDGGEHEALAMRAGCFDVSDPIDTDSFSIFYYDRPLLRMVCEIESRVNSGEIVLRSQERDFLAIMLSGDNPAHDLAAAFITSTIPGSKYQADPSPYTICKVRVKVGGAGGAVHTLSDKAADLVLGVHTEITGEGLVFSATGPLGFIATGDDFRAVSKAMIDTPGGFYGDDTYDVAKLVARLEFSV